MTSLKLILSKFIIKIIGIIVVNFLVLLDLLHHHRSGFCSQFQFNFLVLRLTFQSYFNNVQTVFPFLFTFLWLNILKFHHPLPMSTVARFVPNYRVKLICNSNHIHKHCHICLSKFLSQDFSKDFD